MSTCIEAGHPFSNALGCICTPSLPRTGRIPPDRFVQHCLANAVVGTACDTTISSWLRFTSDGDVLLTLFHSTDCSPVPLFHILHPLSPPTIHLLVPQAKLQVLSQTSPERSW